MLRSSQNPVLYWRKQHAYTQKDAANLSGLSDQTVRRVEQGTLALPVELAQLIGGSIEFEYEKWRTACRTEIAQEHGPLIAELGEAAIGFSDFRRLVGLNLNISTEPDPEYLSVNGLAKLLRVDPRRITEVERGERLLGLEYRRALLQIGVAASSIAEWANND